MTFWMVLKSLSWEIGKAITSAVELDFKRLCVKVRLYM